MGVFGLCQIHAFIDYVRSKMTKEYFEILFKALVITVVSVVILVGIILTITGKKRFFLLKNKYISEVNLENNNFR